MTDLLVIGFSKRKIDVLFCFLQADAVLEVFVRKVAAGVAMEVMFQEVCGPCTGCQY